MAQSRVVEGDTKLQNANWYWGSITREDARQRLHDRPDGYFLVYDSSTNSGDYCIAVRKGGTHHVVKVMHKESKFGFFEPLEYNSVVDIVKEYQHKSLGLHNRKLDIKLLYPLCRTTDTTEHYLLDKNTSVFEILRRLMSVNKDYLAKLAIYEQLHQQKTEFGKTVHGLQLALQSCTMTLEMLQDQCRLSRESRAIVGQHEMPKLSSNYTLLQERVTRMSETLQTLRQDLTYQTSLNYRTGNDMNNIKPEVRRLLSEREEIKRYLIRKFPDRAEFIDGLLEEESESNLPHYDTTTWLVTCDRDGAERYLTDRPHGTFLIRPRSDTTQPYALSIVRQSTVEHILIYFSGGCYGFDVQTCIFDTLLEMIIKYRRISLSLHNDRLDNVTLLYPVGARTF